MAKQQPQSNRIPPPPWTREALGDEPYNELALTYCGIVPRANFAPDLDLSAAFAAQNSNQQSNLGENHADDSNRN